MHSPDTNPQLLGRARERRAPALQITTSAPFFFCCTSSVLRCTCSASWALRCCRVSISCASGNQSLPEFPSTTSLPNPTLPSRYPYMPHLPRFAHLVCSVQRVTAHLLGQVILVVLHDDVDLGLAKLLCVCGCIAPHINHSSLICSDGSASGLALQVILLLSTKASKALCAWAFLTPNCAR